MNATYHKTALERSRKLNAAFLGLTIALLFILAVGCGETLKGERGERGFNGSDGSDGIQGEVGPPNQDIVGYAYTAGNTGVALVSNGLTVQRTNIGEYRYTFIEPLGSSNYVVLVTPDALGQSYTGNAFSRLPNFFLVYTFKPDGFALGDVNHSVLVLK